MASGGANRGGDRFHALQLAARQYHRRPHRGIALGNGRANAARGTGNERDLSVQAKLREGIADRVGRVWVCRVRVGHDWISQGGFLNVPRSVAWGELPVLL